MKKDNKKIIYISLIISLFFFSIFIFTKDITRNTNDTVLTPPNIAEKIELVYLEIDDKKLETDINNLKNIYDLMVKLKKENKIDFKEKNYTGMGKLIEEINGIENSGEKNWIYYVNGKKANIGVSNYKINNGDIVSWKYEKNY